MLRTFSTASKKSRRKDVCLLQVPEWVERANQLRGLRRSAHLGVRPEEGHPAPEALRQDGRLRFAGEFSLKWPFKSILTRFCGFFFSTQISNAQTKEEYKDDHSLIPKNTSLIVARIPLSNQNKKNWEIAQATVEKAVPNPSAEGMNHDISRMNGSEEDKIQAMMMQSTLDYDPTK